jgi:hypothetical protein
VRPLLHVRAMLPVQAAYACPSLPLVLGSPVSASSERLGHPGGHRPPLRRGLPGAHSPGTVRAAHVLAASLHASRALGGPRPSLGQRTKALPLCWLLARYNHRRLSEPRYRGGITLQSVRSL